MMEEYMSTENYVNVFHGINTQKSERSKSRIFVFILKKVSRKNCHPFHGELS